MKGYPYLNLYIERFRERERERDRQKERATRGTLRCLELYTYTDTPTIFLFAREAAPYVCIYIYILEEGPPLGKVFTMLPH